VSFLRGVGMGSRELVLAVLSGLLLVLAFPYFSFSFMVWFALIPFLWLIYESTPSRSFLYGLVVGFVFFGGLTYWLLVLVRFYGFLGFLAWLLPVLLEAVAFALFALGAALMIRGCGSWERLFLLPAWWVSLEFLRSIGSWGFSWGVLGYSQQPNPFVLQMAKFSGVYGISYLIVLVNIVSVELLLAYGEARYPSPPPLAGRRLLFKQVGLVAGILLLILGGGCFGYLTTRVGGEPFKVAIVQPSIPQWEKLGAGKEEEIRGIYSRLTEEAVEFRPHLIVWPETAIPGDFSAEKAYLDDISRLCGKEQCYLLLGSLFEEDGLHNSAFLLPACNGGLERYDKIYPVPFGEYIPLDPLFGWIRGVAGLGEDIVPGEELTIFNIGQGAFGATICFESTNSTLCRRLVERGARMLIVITNDAWFERTAAARQHVEMTALRAVENGVYVVQAANSGISAIIDPRGCIFGETNLFERRILTGEVAFAEDLTFYARFGDVFSYICLILAAGGFLICTPARKIFKSLP